MKMGEKSQNSEVRVFFNENLTMSIRNLWSSSRSNVFGGSQGPMVKRARNYRLPINRARRISRNRKLGSPNAISRFIDQFPSQNEKKKKGLRDHVSIHLSLARTHTFHRGLLYASVTYSNVFTFGAVGFQGLAAVHPEYAHKFIIEYYSLKRQWCAIWIWKERAEWMVRPGSLLRVPARARVRMQRGKLDGSLRLFNRFRIYSGALRRDFFLSNFLQIFAGQTIVFESDGGAGGDHDPDTRTKGRLKHEQTLVNRRIRALLSRDNLWRKRRVTRVNGPTRLCSAHDRPNEKRCQTVVRTRSTLPWLCVPWNLIPLFSIYGCMLCMCQFKDREWLWVGGRTIGLVWLLKSILQYKLF